MPEGFTKIQKETYQDGCISPSSEPHYPYGTSLNLRDELIDDLGIEALSVGDVVEVRALAVVKSKSEHEDDSESSRSLDLQLTQMKVKREDKDRVEQLYGD